MAIARSPGRSRQSEMFYDFAITLGEKGSGSERVEQKLNLTHGIIHRVEIQFPIGTRALAHCQIFHHRHQVWPTNIDGSFTSDGYTIPIDENYEFFEPPHNLVAICWNDDDTYPHTITIRVGIIESKAALMMLGVFKGLTKLLKLMGIKV